MSDLFPHTVGKPTVLAATIQKQPLYIHRYHCLYMHAYNATMHSSWYRSCMLCNTHMLQLKGGQVLGMPAHCSPPPYEEEQWGSVTARYGIYIYICVCMHIYIYIHICIRMPTNYFKLCCVDSLHIHVSPMACSPMLAETCRTPDTWPRHPHATLGPLQDSSPKQRCRA